MMPASRSAFAVPPVDKISAPRAVRPWAISTTPVLSETLINARFMLDMGALLENDWRLGRDGRRIANDGLKFNTPAFPGALLRAGLRPTVMIRCHSSDACG